MTTLERARAKRNEIVAVLGRISAKRDKAVEALVRIEAKRISLIRALVRSEKRIDKLAQVAPHNAGPLPKAEPEPVDAIAATPAPLVIDDGIPEELRRDPQEDKDAKARRELAEQQTAAKKIKERNRAALRNAKARGDLKKMPLTGKAALAFINQG